MITVYRKKLVLNYHIVYGYGAKKIRTVMLEEGKTPPARGTIRKFINTYDHILKTRGLEAAMAYAGSKDEFHTPDRQPTKLDKEAREYIEYWLGVNKQRKAVGNAKQCIDMQEVHRLLRDEKGYDISYQTVTAYAREYVARVESSGQEKAHECFVRQFHPAGVECQFDWGEVKLIIAGKAVKVRMAAFVLPHSNHRRGYLFIKEHTLAFQESHRNYIHDIGHIPQTMVYDNMKVAVKSFVGDKVPTDALLDMSSFYGFRFRFCNARRGNEKGNVEETVKVLRKAAFSVRMEFDSLEEAQKYLDMVCERLNRTEQSEATKDIVTLAQEDFDAMKPWKEDFACFQLLDRQVNNYGVIRLEKAFYSVPDRLTLKSVKLRNYTNKIEILEAGRVVATHEKVADGKWRISLGHYLTTLSHKPGAVKNSEAMRQAPEALQKLFAKHFVECPKDFVELLLFAKDNDRTFEDITDAYADLKRKNVSAVTLSVMKSVLSAEECETSVLEVMSQQDSEDVESQADAGLNALACLISNQNLNTMSYGAAHG